MIQDNWQVFGDMQNVEEVRKRVRNDIAASFCGTLDIEDVIATSGFKTSGELGQSLSAIRKLDLRNGPHYDQYHEVSRHLSS